MSYSICTAGLEEYNPNTRARLRENLLQNYSKDIHPVKSHKDKIQVTENEAKTI
jgi:hypothetical protein